MHYSMLIMLLGYLISYLCAGTHMGKILLPGNPSPLIPLPAPSHCKSFPFTIIMDKRIAHMEKRAIDIKAVVTIKNDHTEKPPCLILTSHLSFSHLHSFKGFCPQNRRGDESETVYPCNYQNDPGKYYYFIGMLLFTLGLFLYLWEKLIPSSRSFIGQSTGQTTGVQ